MCAFVVRLEDGSGFPSKLPFARPGAFPAWVAEEEGVGMLRSIAQAFFKETALLLCFSRINALASKPWWRYEANWKSRNEANATAIRHACLRLGYKPPTTPLI